MLAFLLSDLANFEYWWRNPLTWIVVGFQIWMVVDAIQREEWLWAFFNLFFLSALLYFFLVYRQSPQSLPRFELPGASNRHRIKELEQQIKRLDKPHLYLELGDIYHNQGKLDKAESCYRAALDRDGEDLDVQAHLGQCLFRKNQLEPARQLLEKVCRQNPKHDYGESLMALAETIQRLGQPDQAIALWEQALEQHSYPKARVHLAQIFLAQGQTAPARAQLEEALADQVYAPDFQRKREKFWVRRARRLLQKL